MNKKQQISSENVMNYLTDLEVAYLKARIAEYEHALEHISHSTDGPPAHIGPACEGCAKQAQAALDHANKEMLLADELEELGWTEESIKTLFLDLELDYSKR